MILSRWILLTLTLLLVQCSLFRQADVATELTKPVPVEGYDALKARIHYPRALREAGVEGTVLAKIHISPTGDVDAVDILNSVDSTLDAIVSQAIQRTQFQPATQDGKPYAVWISIPFEFALEAWEIAPSPFRDFQMTIHSEPDYERFSVSLTGNLSAGAELPLTLECLLPLNHSNPWVRGGEGAHPATVIQDDRGSWIRFQVTERTPSFGFEYRPLPGFHLSGFRYVLALNQALPAWTLVVEESTPLLRVDLPTTSTETEEGLIRHRVSMPAMEPYQAQILDMALVRQTRVAPQVDP